MIFKRLKFFILTTMILAGSYSFRIDTFQEQEYLLKAAFLYRFVDYIEWGGTNDEEIFNIAVLGESDILMPLTRISKDKKARNKKIIVKQYMNVNDLGNCQMIFISRNYKLPVENIIAKTDYKPILIISEQEEDFIKGAHMNFFLLENKLKFEVNLNAIAHSGLKISSQLLQHAFVLKVRN